VTIRDYEIYTVFGPILNVFQAVQDDVLDREIDSTGLTCPWVILVCPIRVVRLVPYLLSVRYVAIGFDGTWRNVVIRCTRLGHKSRLRDRRTVRFGRCPAFGARVVFRRIFSDNVRTAPLTGKPSPSPSLATLPVPYENGNGQRRQYPESRGSRPNSTPLESIPSTFA